jgi:3-oxo-5-alpha-steroid 4-dehydrogenase 1
MTEPVWYYVSVLVWAAVGAITFIYLFFQTAPYGRHTASGWGPMISNRLGWMIMEGVSPVFISFWFWLGHPQKSPMDYLLYALYTGHYIYRGYVFPFLTRTKGKKMPVSITFSAVFFNLVNTFFIGYFLGFLGGRPSISILELAAGLLLFFGGFSTHVISDQMLIHLRKPGETGYKIPRGFLFRYVVSPNYLGEVIEWVGFAILAGSTAGWLFVIWTLANLMPRAYAHLKWYRKAFPDFPAGRKAMFPGLF